MEAIADRTRNAEKKMARLATEAEHLLNGGSVDPEFASAELSKAREINHKLDYRKVNIFCLRHVLNEKCVHGKCQKKDPLQ